MWIISNNEKHLLYKVTPNKQHVVSRKGGDLVLNDQSVSRKHAQLYIKCENGKECIVLIDFGSKYGTFVIVGSETTRVPPNDPYVIHDGNKVRFGVQDEIWSVKNIPLLVTTSMLSNDEKNEVKDIIYSLGGKVVESWQTDCTHLTMSGLTLTVKVVCALAQACPVVTLEYWRAITEKLNKMQGPYPDIKDFVPPLKETALINKNDISFLPNPDRKKLFTGMTFIAATSKQLKRIKSMVTTAGGRAVEIGTSDVNMNDEGTVLMQHSANDDLASQPSQLSQTYLKAERSIKARNLRCIPESDIGLSVVFCSVSHYCNPKFSLHKVLLHKNPAQPTQNSTIIPETQEEPVCDRKTQCIEVPESCPLSEDFQNSEIPATKKRNREDEYDCGEGSSKKLCPSSASQNDLFLSEPNQFNIASVSNPAHSTNKSILQVELMKGKKKVVNDNDPFAFPSDLIKPQTSKQTDEDMFASLSCKSKQVKSPNKVESKSKNPSGDMFAFVSPVNSKQKPSTKCSIDMFASSGQSSKRRRDKNCDFSLHLEDEMEMGKQQKAADSSRICLVNQQDSLNESKNRKKVKLDENDPFAFPNQMGHSSNDAVGDGFDFPVNIAINNTDSCNQFDIDSQESSVRANIKGRYVSHQTDSNFGGQKKLADQQQRSEVKSVVPEGEGVVKQEPEDEIDMNLHSSQNIQFKRLIVRRPVGSRRKGTEQQSNCKNFKKFRKVLPLNKSIVPRIIGGSDVFVYEAPVKIKPEDFVNDVPNGGEDIDDW